MPNTINIRVESMQGLGDNIYQRPHVQALSEQGNVYIATSWPELYADIPGVRFVKPTTRLRTQAKNYERSDVEWVEMPQHPDRCIRFGYNGTHLQRGNIPATMRKASGISDPPPMSLPDFGNRSGDDRPIAFVRPVTERREWLNSARNPRPEYIAATVDRLRDTHLIVSVADVVDGEEWIVPGGEIDADVRFERGELPFVEMMALFQAADVVVGGVGWIVPAAIAGRKKAVIIGGGQLGHNHIERLTDRTTGTSLIRYAEPSPGCYCIDMRHNCEKTIEGFDEWLSSSLTW